MTMLSKKILQEMTPEFRKELKEALEEYVFKEPSSEFYAQMSLEAAKLAKEIEDMEKLLEPTPEQLSKRFTT